MPEFIARRPTCKAVQWDGSSEKAIEIFDLYAGLDGRIPGRFEIIQRFHSASKDDMTQMLRTPLRTASTKPEFELMHVTDWFILDELGHVSIVTDGQFKREWEIK